ncbi:MAG: hypothetical protein ACJ0Q6_05340 [Candidatus Azotimanducaceae bacterium]|uniref:HEAT repeat domain-containing protein n=1 Tax=OM182 bacterium TaxID=2510334 RepID=A0A520RZW9_9GAMM|nr:hypothetical protein [Gammaproteobacteria bacterium]RZO75769.1 MAG: hypothetical protein EVA68_06130 [OM182 bacterium]
MNIKMIFNYEGRDIEFSLADDDDTVVNSVYSVMYSEDEANIEPKKELFTVLIKSKNPKLRALAVEKIDEDFYDDDTITKLMSDVYMEVLNVLVTTNRFKEIVTIDTLREIMTREVLHAQDESWGEPEEYQLYDSRANIASYCQSFDLVSSDQIAQLVMKHCSNQDFVLLELARGMCTHRESLEILAQHNNSEISEAARERLAEIDDG